MKVFTKNILRNIFIVPVLAFAVGMIGSQGVAALECGPAGADRDKPVCQAQQGAGATNAGNGKGLSGNIKAIVNVLLFILGAAAVIVIVISGLKYVTSDGDASKIKSAKDTLLYAIVGLVIALLAYAIVNWVLTQFTA